MEAVSSSEKSALSHTPRPMIGKLHWFHVPHSSSYVDYCGSDSGTTVFYLNLLIFEHKKRSTENLEYETGQEKKRSNTLHQ